MLFSDFESDIKRAHPTNLPIISHFLEDRMGTGTKPQGGNSTHQERRFLKGLGGRGNFSLRSSQPPDFQSDLKGALSSSSFPTRANKVSQESTLSLDPLSKALEGIFALVRNHTEQLVQFYPQ